MTRTWFQPWRARILAVPALLALGLSLALGALFARPAAAHDLAEAQSAGRELPELLLLVTGLAAAALALTLPLSLWLGHRLLRRLDKATPEAPAGAPPAAPPGTSTETLAEAIAAFRQATSEHANLSRQLAFLSLHDGLTGLPNRRVFQDRLEQALALARREGQGLAVYALDIDDFGALNTSLGLEAGDQLLRGVANRLSDALRQSDTLARLTKDQFAVVAPRVGTGQAAEALAERIFGALATPFVLQGRTVRATVSLGVSLADPLGGGSAVSLLREALEALKQAQEEGGGKLSFHDRSMAERLAERKALEIDLREADARGEFSLAFQPQAALGSGTVLGAEAFPRWRHPLRGDVPPDVFIPLAEETGLIGAIGEWVLREACRAARAWPDLRIAVNVSPLQLREARFVTTVERVLAETGLAPSLLELEITETVMFDQGGEALGTLNRLRRLGLRLVLDDFGTGYASLSGLQRFPVDKIKLDRGFVARLPEDQAAAALVRAAIGIGSALGVTTQAEGVETQAQRDFLQAEGCAEGQGFLIGRPLPLAAFEAAFLPRSPGATAG